MKIVLIALLFLVVLSYNNAYIFRRVLSTKIVKFYKPFWSRTASFRHYAEDTNISDGVCLIPLINIESDSSSLNKRIVKWLDEEYIPQRIHTKLGNQVQMVYKQGRLRGIDDLGEMLMEIGTCLEAVDMEDAFVNGWDIANKASDFLIDMLDTGSIVLSDKSDNTIDETAEIKNTMRNLSTEFARYKLLADFLDGEVSWEVIRIVVGLTLGFRLKSTDSIVAESVFVGSGEGDPLRQNTRLAPLKWEGLLGIPDVSDVNDIDLAKRMMDDLPEEEGASDMVMESIAGAQMYLQMKTSKDEVVQRRILIAKWLYVQGFLSGTFPAVERFIPGHLPDELDD